MNLHEYQSKGLLRDQGIVVPEGKVVKNLEEAIHVYESFGSDRIVVKAQVHAGGRGLAGGVCIVSSKEELTEAVKRLIGTNLVTKQTTEEGQPINCLLLESPSVIKRELYLSFLVNRSSRTISLIASKHGGMDIEEVAEKMPNEIHQIDVNPVLGLCDFQIRELAKALEFTKPQTKEFAVLLKKFYDLFISKDLSLIEVNPLIVDDHDHLVCLDAKITADENALYRQSEINSLRDPSQEDERENKAKDWELNYIHLDGNIGCMVNGAGLAMATMDIIKLCGGEPANFLDVGGGATKERVTEALKIILSDTEVKAIFINIFGGIVRCDLIAEGIIAASAQCNIQIPVVVRLVGNNAEKGSELLNQSGLNLIANTDLEEAAKLVVKHAGVSR